ncbi:nucleotidyltransferase domain-containing protein [Patescibacteria group bacterium]
MSNSKEQKASKCSSCGYPGFAGHASDCEYELDGVEEGGQVEKQDFMQFQERDPFGDFMAHIDQGGERREATQEEEKRMDQKLLELGRIFDGSGVRWHLDGALNVSLQKGEYIGIHKDVDISVEADDLERLDEHLKKVGYGLFLSQLKDPNKDESRRILERVDGKAFRQAAEEDDGQRHPTINAIDSTGKILDDSDLNSIDVHIVRRNEQGNPYGWHGVELPAKWFEPQSEQLKGVELNLSYPAKVAYFKIHGTRSYDQTDLYHLAQTKELTLADVDEIARVLESEKEIRLDRGRQIFKEIFQDVTAETQASEIVDLFLNHPIVGRRTDAVPRFEKIANNIIADKDKSIERMIDIVINEFAEEAEYKDEKEKLAQLREWCEQSQEKE